MKTQKTIKMAFNEYVEFINKNNKFDLIQDMNQLLSYYKSIIGVDFNAELASIEVKPSQSTIIISMPDAADFVSRNRNYGFKNFSL